MSMRFVIEPDLIYFCRGFTVTINILVKKVYLAMKY